MRQRFKDLLSDKKVKVGDTLCFGYGSTFNLIGISSKGQPVLESPDGIVVTHWHDVDYCEIVFVPIKKEFESIVYNGVISQSPADNGIASGYFLKIGDYSSGLKELIDKKFKVTIEELEPKNKEQEQEVVHIQGEVSSVGSSFSSDEIPF